MDLNFDLLVTSSCTNVWNVFRQCCQLPCQCCQRHPVTKATCAKCAVSWSATGVLGTYVEFDLEPSFPKTFWLHRILGGLLVSAGKGWPRSGRISDFLRGWTEAFCGIVKLSKLFRFESPVWPSCLLLDRCSGFRAGLGEWRYSNGVMPNGM